MATTIYTLDNVYCQIINPSQFKLVQNDSRKKDLKYTNYANAGFFGKIGDGKTIPAGNLAINGKILSDAKTQASWINTARKPQTTIYTTFDDKIGMVKTDDLTTIPNLKYAISGVPILKDGWNQKQKYKEEGYFGSEMYNTWHTFLGIQEDRLVVVGAKVGASSMPYLMDVLGLRNSIKLDGGGSFIMHSMDFTTSTSENRVINNIIVW